MKLTAKIAIAAAAVAGVSATTMYAAPGDATDARIVTLRAEAQDDYQHVFHLQAIARREKDVIKLNCVNDKLVQIKAQMNVLDRLTLGLQAERDAGDAMGTMQTVVQTRNSVHGLREAADQCIGEHLLVTESSNMFTHPDIPDNPGAEWAGTFSIEPPAYASPVN